MSDAKPHFERIAVIGAGTMGNGIAQTFASFGTSVHLVDVSEEVLTRGVTNIEKSLGRFVKKEKMTAEAAKAIVDRIVPSTSIEDVQYANLVVEAASVKIEIKRDIFGRLDSITDSACILASNTSSISRQEA